MDIDGSVLAQLKQRRREVDGTLGSLVSQLLARALHDDSPVEPEPLRWSSTDMGARIDLTDADALDSALEESR